MKNNCSKKISVLLFAFLFALFIHSSDESVLQHTDDRQIHYEDYNETRFIGNVTCCCKPSNSIEKIIFIENIKVFHRNGNEKICENVLNTLPCFCFLKLNEITHYEENQSKICWNISDTAVYISVGVVAFILLLTLMLCLLLIRKKRKGLLIERLSERQHGLKDQNAITGKSYTENHELKLYNEGLNHEEDSGVKRDNLIVKEREMSNIYHSLDNLHITPRESSLHKIQRGPYPLPNYNSHEDDSFNNKVGPSGSTVRLAPQMQPPLQKSENAFFAAELNNLFNKKRLLDNRNNTYEADIKLSAEENLRHKPYPFSAVPKVSPNVKSKPAFTFKPKPEEILKIPPPSQLLLKSKTEAPLGTTFKSHAPSVHQTNVPTIHPFSEYEDDDEWTYEQLPSINIYNI